MKFPRFLGNILALVLGIGVALALAELGTRLIRPQQLSGSWLINGPQGILINKAGGSPVRHELRDGRVVYYRFNSWHQRGDEEPDPNAARVLVLGDSFTFGWGLDTTETFVDNLQRRLDARGDSPRVQLLGAATGGWGAADQLAYLEAFGERLAPSAVVVFVNFGDPSRSATAGVYRISSDRQSVAPVDRSDQNSRLKAMLQGIALYGFLLERSHFLQLLRNAIVFSNSNPAPSPEPREVTDERAHVDGELAALIYRRLAEWCSVRDVQLTMLTTGWPIFHFPWLEETMRREGIFFRDLNDAIAEGMKGHPLSYWSISGDGHPNENGSKLIENAAWSILDERLTGLNIRPFGSP